MLGESEEKKEGKINWPLGVGVSLGIHVILFGLLWLIASPSSESAPEPAEKAETQAETQETSESEPETPARPAETTRPTPTRSTTTRSTTRATRSTQTSGTRTGATTTHVVAPGENLTKIAAKYGCTVAELKKLNGLTSDKIGKGNSLKVPEKP